MNLDRRVAWIGYLMALLLALVSLRIAYWQLVRGRALDPVAFDPRAAQQEYAQLSGTVTPGAATPGAPVNATPDGSVVMDADPLALAQLPQPVMQRTANEIARIKRGSILDRGGVVLAQDVGEPGSYQRQYLDLSLAQTIGYVSGLRSGVTGLEASYNRDLLGLDSPTAELARSLDRPITGSDLVLTIDSSVQQTAAQALGDRPGAVVALDADTGAVLALVSAPGYDPNHINDAGYLESLAQMKAPLINRATQALYIPGSVFKTITLIAALDSGQVNADTVFDFGEPRYSNGKPYYIYTVGNDEIIDPNHAENKLDLQMAYVTSANAAFARMAYEMNPDTLIDYAARLGFSDPNYAARFPLELPESKPQLANQVNELHSNALLRALTGFGQGELLTTPINMAMVIEAVLNEGSIPTPYLVEQVKDPSGLVLHTRPSQHTEKGIMSAQTADFVRDAMIALVKRFYGGDSFIPGAVSGGKTGTAQLSGDQSPHAWFTGFAEQDGRRVVVAVVVENAGSGSSVAAPIFRQVAAAALAAQQR